MNKYILPIILILLFVSNCYGDDYDQYFQQAVKLAREGNSAEGERILSLAIGHNHKNVKLYLYRGKFRQKYTHDTLAAIADYNIIDQITTVPPVELYWYRGMCYYDLKMYRQAIIDYSRAIRIKPKWGKIYYYRAKAYAQCGRINRAVDDLKKLIKYSPKYKHKAEVLYNEIIQGRRDL